MNNYVLYCLKCKSPASANLVIQRAGSWPHMGIEISCACKGKQRSLVGCEYCGSLYEESTIEIPGTDAYTVAIRRVPGKKFVYDVKKANSKKSLFERHYYGEIEEALR